VIDPEYVTLFAISGNISIVSDAPLDGVTII
jgi:hypothetical protein